MPKFMITKWKETDYYRFIYEFSTESIDKDISGDNAEVAYKNANELAKR